MVFLESTSPLYISYSPPLIIISPRPSNLRGLSHLYEGIYLYVFGEGGLCVSFV